MGTESLSACLRQLGVDEISHLKCNSIRELHRFHVERGASLDWKTIACQNNGLLLYAIASQFLNPRACYEELVACCEELLSFHSFVNIVMPIFLDEQLGGVNRVNQCFTFFFSTLRRDTPSADCDPSVYAWYECVVCYLPFSPSLLQQMQLFFVSFPSSSLLRCMIRLAQNNVDCFLQTVAAPDALSSTLLSLLNETPFTEKDGFASVLWQFVLKCMQAKSDLFFASDVMVLVDILIRSLKDEDDAFPVWARLGSDG